jgi:predicted secreted hydrolase
MKVNSQKFKPTKFSRCAIRLVIVALCLGFITGAAEIPRLTEDGFAVPQPGRQFIFPRDHGSHPEFAIEWWYITGHLTATNDSSFGFQATFFRRALVPPDTTNTASSAAFGNRQIYLAHMALVNKKSGDFSYQERLNRDGWDAEAATNTLAVRNGNWSLRLVLGTNAAAESFALQGGVGADATFTLNLIPKTSLVIFGTNGVSRKVADPCAASHYLTFPRLTVAGLLKLNATNLAVTGEAWMDHEFSSSQLGKEQVGWDWLSLQLFDGRELMAYRMRGKDDSTDPFSTVAWIDQQGQVQQVGPDKFNWSARAHWHSLKSGAEYPSLVQLAAFNPASGKTENFIIQPYVADQELTGKVGGVGYWEGACRVLDENNREIGRAYMEFTGYSKSLKGSF